MCHFTAFLGIATMLIPNCAGGGAGEVNKLKMQSSPCFPCSCWNSQQFRYDRSTILFIHHSSRIQIEMFVFDPFQSPDRQQRQWTLDTDPANNPGRQISGWIFSGPGTKNRNRVDRNPDWSIRLFSSLYVHRRQIDVKREQMDKLRLNRERGKKRREREERGGPMERGRPLRPLRSTAARGRLVSSHLADNDRLREEEV